MLKKLARSALRFAGYEAVPIGGRLNLILIEALERILPGIDIVLDVGANTGQYRDYLRSALRYGGRIVSFEPNPPDFERLVARSAGDPQWDVHPWALGAEEGTATLNVMASSDFSSFLTPLDGPVRFEGNVISGQATVPVRRLDDVLAELGISPASSRIYLKLDTQGYDLQVLRGGPTSLRQILALQSEVSVLPIYDGSPDYLDAIREMRGYGFEVAAMAPVSFHQGTVIEFDCVMLNQALSKASAPPL